MFAFFKQYFGSRPAPTSSIMGATGRYDFLGEDLSDRLNIIKDIHRLLLQADESLLDWENRDDVAKPGDSSRPSMFKNRDLINQARLWAALWSLERPRLDIIHQRLSDKSDDYFPDEFVTSLGVIHELVWWFTRAPPESRETEAGRNDAQRGEVCVEGDSKQAAKPLTAQHAPDRAGGKCCITGRDDAERCHIIPLWTLTRPERSKFLEYNLEGFLGAEEPRLSVGLLRFKIGITWNTIYMSRELRMLWDKGLFALEPLGYDSRPKHRETSASAEHAEKKDIEHCLKLRFHWLPKTSVQGLRATLSTDLLNASPRDLIQAFETDDELQTDSLRRVDSGKIITIWADRREDLPAIGFLRVRWLACLIHRFAGGIDPKAYEPLFPNSDDVCAIDNMLWDAEELTRLRKCMADLELRIKNRLADA